MYRTLNLNTQNSSRGSKCQVSFVKLYQKSRDKQPPFLLSSIWVTVTTSEYGTLDIDQRLWDTINISTAWDVYVSR